MEACKNDKRTQDILLEISKNIEEPEDIRFVALTSLLRYFKYVDQSYIEYKKHEDDYVRPDYLKQLPQPENEVFKPKIYEISGNYIDALPFVEGAELSQDESLRRRAFELISREMNNLSYNQDYHGKYKSNSKSQFIEKEVTRINKNVQLNVINDVELNLELPPPSQYYDEKIWKDLKFKYSICSETINSSLFNLDIYNKYSPQAWVKYLETIDNFVKQLEIEKKRLEEKNLEINKKRKYIQV